MGDYSLLEEEEELGLAINYSTGRQNVPCAIERFRVLHIIVFEMAPWYHPDASQHAIEAAVGDYMCHFLIRGRKSYFIFILNRFPLKYIIFAPLK